MSDNEHLQRARRHWDSLNWTGAFTALLDYLEQQAQPLNTEAPPERPLYHDGYIQHTPSTAAPQTSGSTPPQPEPCAWVVETHTNWDREDRDSVQYGLTNGTYHILMPKGEKLSMVEQHARYLNQQAPR